MARIRTRFGVRESRDSQHRCDVCEFDGQSSERHGELDERVFSSLLFLFLSDFTQKVKQICGDSPFDFYLNVLTRPIWPQLPESRFEEHDEAIHFPPSMQRIIDAFNSLPKDSERSYHWSFVRGYITAEIAVQSRKVEIQMLPVQFAVLSQFPADETLSAAQLQERTGMSEELLLLTLDSLTNSVFNVWFGGKGEAKILKKVAGEAGAMQMSDQFQFNAEFSPAVDHIRLRGVGIEMGFEGSCTRCERRSTCQRRRSNIRSRTRLRFTAS